MVLKNPFKISVAFKAQISCGINCKHRGLLNLSHGSCSLPFEAEEVSFLVTAMVYGRPFPAGPDGREKEKYIGCPFPPINIRGNFLRVHLPVTF